MPRRHRKNSPCIVSLAPNATSILCALGARSSLVGVTRWCPEIAPVKHLPQFGDCWKLDSVAEILKLKPDLLIGSVPFKTETLGKLLEHPVRFLALNPRSLADIESDTRLVAGLVDKRVNANRVIAAMQREFAATRNANRKKRRLRVYCEAWSNPRITSPTWVAELAELSNAEFVGTPGARITDEAVAAANPDAIVLAWAATGDRAKPETAYANKKWRDVSAVRNRCVFVVPDELLNTPAPILTRGAQLLAQVLDKARRQSRSVA